MSPSELIVYNQLQMKLIKRDYEYDNEGQSFLAYAMNWIYRNAESFRKNYISTKV